MAVLQLVFADDSDAPRIEPQPNPDAKDPDELQEEGVPTVDVGSDLLIQFASQLAAYGFRILEVSLVNRYFGQADQDTTEELEPAFRSLISNNLQAAKQFKRDYLPDLFVSSIRFHSPETGNELSLGQEGVVHAKPEDIKYLTAALNTA